MLARRRADGENYIAACTKNITKNISCAQKCYRHMQR